MKKSFGIFVALSFYLLTSCNQTPRLKFAVAANLIYPMQEIQSLYEEQYGRNFDLISGSSGVLSAQIQNGAPFDLFFSANMKYPLALYEGKYAADAPIVLIEGRCIFWSKNELEGSNIESYLRSGEAKTLAVANAELAPYGAKAHEWLQEKGLWGLPQTKLIQGENVGQVNQYIRVGSVDAAFTAISAFKAPQLQGHGYWQPLLDEENAGIPHGILLLEESPEARSLVQFLQSPQAQEIFLKYGYTKTL